MNRGTPSQSEAPSPANDAPAPPNRLAIGHLLLWTAATAVVFAALVTIEERDAGRNNRRSEFGLRMHRAHYVLALAVAPAHGAALAGMVLAGWRTMMQRWGFPTQPGHWLLIASGILPLAFLAAQLNHVPGQSFASVQICWIGLVGTAVLVTTAVQFVDRPLRWARAFLVGSWGLLLLSFQLIVAMVLFNGDTWFFWYVLNLVLSIPAVAAILLAFVASLLDLRCAERWDPLHWIGLATFWIIVSHPIIGLMIDSWMVGRFQWILV
jgi:hypothetical protein